ncbi:FAD/NAD(P)-binding domain-containing protein [Hyaloscypha hepaticicola]|uniref:FAD/NAD(P)-binding domain-containing protein n=1 Tax=Hyaloscypha hepaticicola TaxID=2082293 RepID=A0A2J6QH34_9HELO|nr:FAD/NAD(P)-binding domain-containing protein [Hyaloscypha hepaticicola]
MREMSTQIGKAPNGRRVIIIGAGIHGLAAAKTYLQIVPHVQLTIIDNNDTVGGVWSRKVHPNLMADSSTPTFDFSELQMSDEFDIPEWSSIPGSIVYEYLERYAKKFDVLRRCMFNTQVTSVERNGKGWKVHTKAAGDEPTAKEQTLTCDILMVANGHFAVPRLPNIDTSAFTGKVFHTKDLNTSSDALSSKDIKTVAVVGGNKSSFEAICLANNAGKNAHWIIREDGAGPSMFFRTQFPNGMSTSKMGYMRFTSILFPSVYRPTRSWWDRLVVSGKYAWGNKLFEWFWQRNTDQRIGDRYEKSENGRLLKPKILNLFWSQAGISFIHNRDTNVLDAIDRGERIHVVRASISAMKGNILYLSNQSQVDVDAVVFATGWENSPGSIFSPELQADLGLPVLWDSLPESKANYWKQLDASEDQKILNIYPLFDKRLYKYTYRDVEYTPFRLFRGLIPPSVAAERNIVFLGKVGNVQQTSLAEINALWSVAYLEGLLPLESLVSDQEAMNREVARTNAFMKRRYPGRRNIPLALLEVRDLMDLLLRDLGVRTDRNRLAWENSANKVFGWWGLKGWMAEWFKPYEPVVYKGIVEEFLARAVKQDDNKKTR